MMHLAIDGLGARRGGTANVLLSVLEAALETDAIGLVTLFAAPEHRRSFDLPISSKLTVLQKPLAAGVMPARAWWFAHGLQREVARHGADLLLCLNGGGYQPTGVTGATLLQQPVPFCREALALFDLPSQVRFAFIEIAMRHSAKRSTLVLVQTPTMKEWVNRDFAIPHDKIHVFTPTPPRLPLLGPLSYKLAEMRAAEPGRRLLFVGDPYPYKNVQVAIEGLQILRRTYNGARLFLTFDPEHPLCRAPGVSGLGRLTRQELREAYELATALVMPSLVETVGLPLLEAAQVGVPGIAADRPYAHDVCGEAALYFDPSDMNDLVRQARAIFDRPGLRASLAEIGRGRIAVLSKARPYQAMLDLMIKVHRTAAPTSRNSSQDDVGS